MKKDKTHKGFTLYEFIDRYNVKCSLQKSSIATEDCIWLGCDEANPRRCVKGKGWIPINLKGDVCYDTRMHLTREQVKKLLPMLIKFVIRGEI